MSQTSVNIKQSVIIQTSVR